MITVGRTDGRGPHVLVMGAAAVRALLLLPGTLVAQELASGPAAMLAAETWSGTVSAFVADTTRSADGEIQKIVSRSIEGTIRFANRVSEGAVGVNAKWVGVGEVSYRVDDWEITPIPGKASLTQTLEGSGRVSLDGRNSTLRILARQGFYNLSFALESFQVDLITEGGAMEEPMRMRTRPQRRDGGLGGSVRRTSLPSAGVVLDVMPQWRLLQARRTLPVFGKGDGTP